MSLTFSASDSKEDDPDFLQGGSFSTYGDLSSSTLQLGYPIVDETGNSSLRAFWSLDEDSGDFKDHTSSSYDATVSGTITRQSGILARDSGKGDGSSYADPGTLGTFGSSHNGNLTFSFLVKAPSSHSTRGFFGQEESNGKMWVGLHQGDGETEGWITFSIADDNDATFAVDTDGDIGFNDGSWHQITIVIDTSSATGNIYMDGVDQNATVQVDESPSSWSDLDQEFYLFARNNQGSADLYWDESLDEIRIYEDQTHSSSQASNLAPTNWSPTTRWSDKSFSSTVNVDRLELTNGTVNVPADTTLKATVHRTDGSNNIQESSDELDLSNSFPIDVTGLSTDGKHFALELSTVETSDVTTSPTFDTIDLTEDILGLSGTTTAQSSSTTGSLSNLTSITGTSSTSDSTTDGRLDNPLLVLLTGTVVAQDSSTSGSISGVATITGSVSSQSSNASGSLSADISITGTVQSDSSATGSITTVATLSGTTASQDATVDGRFVETGGRDLPDVGLSDAYADLDIFVEMQFDNGTERYWSGVGDKTLDIDGDKSDETFTGDGTLLGINTIKESLGLRADKLTIDLSGLKSGLRDTILTKPIQEETVKVWLVFWDDSREVKGDPVLLFKGHVDDARVRVDPDNPTMRLIAETGTIDWTEPSPQYYDPENQKQEFSNDKGFDFVPQLSDISITWGSETVRPPSDPGVRNIVYGTDKVSKPPVFYASPDGDCFLHVVQPAAAHEIDSFEEIYLDDELAWTNSGGVESAFDGNLRVKTHVGTDSQSADSDLKSEVSEWTSDHRLRGVAYVYLRFKLDSNTYPQGLPNIFTVVNGKKVKDTRDNTTSLSDNPAMCMRDYLLDSDLGMNVTTDDLDTRKFEMAANSCDTKVDLEGGGEEKRYTLNGNFNTDKKPREILKTMASAMAGNVGYASGEYYPLAGVERTAFGSYSQNDLKESFELSSKRKKNERFNAVRGKFNNSNEDWNFTNYPSRVDSTAKSDDNDKENWKNIDLPATDSHTMAQRISKIRLEQNRKQLTTSMVFNTRELYKNVVGDVIEFTSDFLGWTNKKFVLQSLTVRFTEAGGGIKMVPEAQLREYDPDVYDWDPASDEKDLTTASTPDLPDTDALHVQEYDSTSDFPSETCGGQLRVARDDGVIRIGGEDVGAGSVEANGQVQLSNGTAVVDTGISEANAIFTLGLGIDDPDADTKVAGRMFWDDSAGNYKIEIKETDTDVGNPTVNYQINRVD